MSKSKLKNIQANGNWKDFYKFDVEFEDGTTGTIFKKSSEHKLEVDKEYNYSKNEKGSIKIIPEGGFTTNYSNNNYSNRIEDVDKAKRIARQSSLTRAVEFHLKKLESGITISETEILEQAQRFTDWVMDGTIKKKKDEEVPF